jgi:succinyl-CoA synthetase beta subunit
MRIQEYQSKRIFSQYGIPIPKGRVAINAIVADHIYEELKSDVVIKAQVLTGGRGKSGGIRLAKSSEQVEEVTNAILGLTIKGIPVRKLLVEEAIKIDQEFFIAIVSDKDAGLPLLMASKYGGMDIEDAVRENSHAIYSVQIDPLAGLLEFQVRSAALAVELPKQLWDDFAEIVLALWKLYEEIDADSVEINPLVISEGKRLIALDAKVNIDDNAIYRHAELSEYFDLEEEDRMEYQANKYGLSYVKLDGNIGCMVNGAGLAMATMDLLSDQGGAPANFLDIGGGANSEKVSSGLKILMEDKRVKVILVNIFGGITRCDEVAKGLLSVFEKTPTKLPVVIRLAGTNAAEGLALLKNSGLIVVESICDAAKTCVKLAKSKSRSKSKTRAA